MTRQLLIDTTDFCATACVESYDSQNVKDAVETAIMNIIEDVVTNDAEEEERQKKRVRQETPNYWDSTWGRMLLLQILISLQQRSLGEDFMFRIRCFPTLLFLCVVSMAY